MTTVHNPLRADHGYFEDFWPGRRIRHARASTIGEPEGSFLAKLVVNTAQAHWNEQFLRHEGLGSGRLVFGLLTASTVFGLAGADCTEHAVAVLSCTGLKFRAPVHHSDTVEAFTEVIAVQPDSARPDAGIVCFKHWGRNQHGTVVFEGQRTVLLHRRPEWSSK